MEEYAKNLTIALQVQLSRFPVHQAIIAIQPTLAHQLANAKLVTIVQAELQILPQVT